ncbi:hypothetical protein N7533_008379 [Penicillium manginii]|jgi:hypothetical protein|uniref:uncharacterized protein n=1 Tax=Penicillium manginii TaxID=203109 RepID=UPI002546E8F3|nr:uncharacterized protein N7533_008305 [Penicillium manginii]XP_056959986.1 uncharacterized protein N7533_008379 [Penicillium manginii]KAJ5751277.1 hypothetical protein N7533_008305 [Penicillium manginii]KAJ5751351.1 hypothetical protein N7533_008379 [Penicillium manginii]
MATGPKWITPSVLDGIEEVPEDESIDIVDTECETESEYSQTESDEAFVVPDDDTASAKGDGVYEPLDVEFSTDDESDVSKPEDLVRTSYLTVRNQDTPDPTILGHREVYRRRGLVKQYEVKLWIDSDHWDFLLELVRSCVEAEE